MGMTSMVTMVVHPFWVFLYPFCKLYNTKALTEKAVAPHSSTLAWKIPWTEEPGRLQSMGSPESDTTERLHFHFSLSCIGEGNGNLLQFSCLENPRDGGAWLAAAYGVAQSRTRLEWLSSSSSSRVHIRSSSGPWSSIDYRLCFQYMIKNVYWLELNFIIEHTHLHYLFHGLSKSSLCLT